MTLGTVLKGSQRVCATVYKGRAVSHVLATRFSSMDYKEIELQKKCMTMFLCKKVISLSHEIEKNKALCDLQDL